MFKIYTTIIALFFVFTVKAQNNNSNVELPQAGNAINIPVTGAVTDDEGNVFFAEAEKNERIGELNQALTLFGKAAFEYSNAKKYNNYGTALLRMSNLHLQLENFTEAEQVILNSVLKNFSKTRNTNGQMAAYHQLGKIYFAANKLTQSLWFYTQEGILAQRLKNKAAYIDSILGIAAVKIKKKEYFLANKDFNKAELLALKLKTNQFKAKIKEGRTSIIQLQKKIS